MSKNLSLHVPAPRALPLAADDVVDADLDVCLSTPLTLVVNASLEIEGDGAERRSLDLALVIPRNKCRGERPLLGALLEAARTAVARAMRSGTTPRVCLPRRVVTRVAGHPYLIPVIDAA